MKVVSKVVSKDDGGKDTIVRGRHMGREKLCRLCTSFNDGEAHRCLSRTPQRAKAAR